MKELVLRRNEGFFSSKQRSLRDEDSSSESSDDDMTENNETSSRRLKNESRRYKTDVVGRLKDMKLVDDAHLEARCFRPDMSVTTAVRRAGSVVSPNILTYYFVFPVLLAALKLARGYYRMKRCSGA